MDQFAVAIVRMQRLLGMPMLIEPKRGRAPHVEWGKRFGLPKLCALSIPIWLPNHPQVVDAIRGYRELVEGIPDEQIARTGER